MAGADIFGGLPLIREGLELLGGATAGTLPLLANFPLEVLHFLCMNLLEDLTAEGANRAAFFIIKAGFFGT